MTDTRPSSEPRLDRMLGRQLDYYATAFRRTWRGSVVTSFVTPWLYVASMGLLLGGYISNPSAKLDGAPSYLAFIAPGLLAATAGQVAVGETMYPVMGAIKWDKTYYGMLASPLRVADIVAGHLGYAMFRVTLSSVVFASVLSVFGLVSSVPGYFGAVAAAMLTGLAFATPIYAFSAGAKSEQGFALVFRLGIIPMFLFSGAFFPISNLPEPLEWLARLTPLWHGVELCRMSTVGTWSPAWMVHVAYLGALAAVGGWLAVRRLTRRLVV